jgi:uncharacterized membrane-anchored protein YhcB (DUF1043 family)
MTSFKDTYDYCEQLINLQLDKVLKELGKWDGETDPFVDNMKQELKDLYKHLENIQKMKSSYLSGR